MINTAFPLTAAVTAALLAALCQQNSEYRRSQASLKTRALASVRRFRELEAAQVDGELEPAAADGSERTAVVGAAGGWQ